MKHDAFQRSDFRLIYPPPSCSPNAYLALDYAAFSATLCAIRDIKDGEEITISYISDLSPDAVKRQEALSHFGFVCNCTSCTSPFSEDLRRVIVQSVSPLPQSLTGVTLADDEKVLRECQMDRGDRKGGTSGAAWLRGSLERGGYGVFAPRQVEGSRQVFGQDGGVATRCLGHSRAGWCVSAVTF